MRFPLSLAVTAVCALPALLHAQFSASTPPECGKYVLATLSDGSFACERYAAFPWFAAGGGWSTQVSIAPLVVRLAGNSISTFQVAPIASQAAIIPPVE
jgi:hypothetical protein